MANQLILLRTIVYPWIKVVVSNWEMIYFWSSNWSPLGRISSYLQSLTLGIWSNSTLAELWEVDHWVLPAARSEEHVSIFSHNTSLTLTNLPDSLLWCLNGQALQNYSTREIYDLLRNETQQVTLHKEVWFSGGIPKHKFFSWLFILNRCPTKDRMA